MSDDWKPRKDDHLVEPMFAGLGAERRDEPAPRTGSRARWIWLFAVIAALLIAWLVARGRSGAG